MAREHSEAAETARCLDEALAETFPASDPPAMTSPSAATPSSDVVVEAAHGPLRVYRVIEAGQAAEPFAPTTAGGRWSPPGHACVYVSLSPAGALLEYLAHRSDGAGDAGDGLLLATAELPPGTSLSECNEPSTWRHLPYRPDVQQVGAAWLASGRSLALRVPSAIVHGEDNMLLSPTHPAFAALQVRALAPLQVDPRLRSAR
jgi:RES domain-containing protein